jgi:hypothetical protein
LFFLSKNTLDPENFLPEIEIWLIFKRKNTRNWRTTGRIEDKNKESNSCIILKSQKRKGNKKMIKINKCLLIIPLLILTIVFFPLECSANSAEPPSIIIIIFNAPSNLEISLGSGPSQKKAVKTDKSLESYYTFSLHDLKTVNNYTLKIKAENKSFEVPLDKPLKSYNNIFTLDLDSQTLTPGKSISRSIFLVSLRLILTLALEAIVFWLFGFKQKSSWITFLTVNLITQGGLNIWLNGFTPLANYLILNLILGEILVFIFEFIIFLSSVKEHGSLITVLYVLTANLLSLLLGGYIITILPI